MENKNNSEISKRIEEKEKKDKIIKKVKIALIVFVIFCFVMALAIGNFSGSSSSRYQQKQVQELKDKLYTKSTDGKYYLK